MLAENTQHSERLIPLPIICLNCCPQGNITGQLLCQLALLRFKTVLLKTEDLEFNTQLRTRLNVIAVKLLVQDQLIPS